MQLRGKLIWLLVLASMWFLSGVFITLHEYFFLANYPGVLSTEPMEEFNFSNNLIAAAFGLFIGGLLFGLLELFFFQKRFARLKFWDAVLRKFLIYSVLLFILISAISLIFNSWLSGRSLADVQAWQQTYAFISSEALWHPVFPFLLLAILSSFLLQLSERFGPNELWRIFTGKYNKPQEEHRIFMFLDLNKSTTLAEELGNQQFYQFLNDFYFDIAPVITKYMGEVVDYVGDLIIISWTYDRGTDRNRCIACFSEFERTIASKQSVYESSYNNVPNFKAAVHCGKVIVGEMGKIKKSIKFSGDVLNTTARVEKVCGDLGAKIAVTQDLISILKDHDFIFEKASNIQLKGKAQPVDIYTLGKS